MSAPAVLTGLFVYPVKSAAGSPVPAWPVDEFGLRHDRRWMIVDGRGRQVTQREHPRLALVRPAIQSERLRITGPGIAPLDLPLEPEGAANATAVVWGEVCAGLSMGKPAACWFSDFLGIPCDLVYMPSATVRPADPAYAPPGVRVSFADAFPFLLISQESLDDLNSRMPGPLPMNRFRPNLVIAGGEPYMEDRLHSFRIGGFEMRAVKPCDRCVLTTIDQATGGRGSEPLRTLATYRKVEGKVFFGQNVVHLSPGRLRVGDPVLV